MTAPFDRDRLAKVLALLASPVDGEALAATRKTVQLLAAAGLRPEQLIAPALPRFEPSPFRYSPPPAPRAHSYDDPFRRMEEYFSRGRRPKPNPLSFTEIGPAEARARLRKLLKTPLEPKPRAFVSGILIRLHEPHTAHLSREEARRLDRMWGAAKVIFGEAVA